MRARGSCWRARRKTCMHESSAGIHAGEHAYTSLVLACTPEAMRARALAGVHAGEHAMLKLKATNLEKTPRSHNRTRPISGRWRHPKIQDELRQVAGIPKLNAGNFERTAPPQNWARSILRK